MSSRFAQEDYAAALWSVLPTGRAWQRDDIRAGFFLGLARTFSASDAAAIQLLADANPATTLNLLPEWEESLGLPDPCAGTNPTIDQRRGQVLARFSGTGGQSRAFFIAYARALGFEVKIVSHAPFRAGRSRAGSSLGGPGWMFAWSVIVISSAGSIAAGAFRAGRSRAGDRLSSSASSTAVLRCEFERLKAAETNVLFPA